MNAVVKVGGKQYYVTEGSEIYVEKLNAASGESVSIPIVFEYYLSVKENISKRIMFDLRNSLVTNPLNYIIEITANYDNS